jgi:hypothetical protein
MKTSRLLTTIAFAFMMLVSFNVDAQKFSDLDKSPMDLAAFPARGAEKLIKVYYSRPQLNGRDVKSLTQKDKVWRTGANEATEVVLLVDMKLGGTLVKAGTYALTTMPGDTEWTVVLKSASSKENTVASITVPVTEGKESLEAFSIAFEKSDDGVHMHMGWGTLRVAVPFVK